MSKQHHGVELSRRQLLSGAITAGVAAAGAGAGTFAYLQDTERSTDNAIEMGTLDLKVSDSDENPPQDGVSGEWTMSNMKPGDYLIGDVTLTNAGSLEADHVELGFDYTETESDGPNGSNEADTKPTSAAGMAEQFEVTMLSYDGENPRRDLVDANGNGRIDIDDLTAPTNAGALDDLTPPPSSSGGTEALTIELEFADDPDNNDYQGDELTLTVTMALHQEQSQDI